MYLPVCSVGFHFPVYIFSILNSLPLFLVVLNLYFCTMKQYAIVLVLISAFYFSCKSKAPVNEKIAIIDTTKFFQVSQYIKSQIDEVNKVPYYIYKLDIVNGKLDSSAISNNSFVKLASQFLKPDINDEKLKPNYKERIFEDKTTATITFNYSAIDKDIELQNVDVILGSDGETVKRLMMRKFYNYKDSSAIEQLSWKPGERFIINRAVQLPNKPEVQMQTIVVWNEMSSRNNK